MRWLKLAVAGSVIVLVLVGVSFWPRGRNKPANLSEINRLPRSPRLDDGGYGAAHRYVLPVRDPLSLEHIRNCFERAGYRGIEALTAELASWNRGTADSVDHLLTLAQLCLYEGEFAQASGHLAKARRVAESDTRLERRLSSLIFLQGVAALRQGEVENCIDCACEGSCLYPLTGPAIHSKREGSTQAVRFFLEYLKRHPRDPGVRWLLNIAAMTLGEQSTLVPAEHLIAPDRFRSEFDVGRFRDVAPRLGLNRLDQSGGAIFDDFDNDGLLDIVETSRDVAERMHFYRNQGDGSFREQGESAGLGGQLGGLYCVQTDYDNDGWLDIFVARGGWTGVPMRPSLLRNNQDGTFTDVTQAAGLAAPVDSQVAAWADYDNDGWLDLFLGGETVASRLYRNRGDGTFAEVATAAGVANLGRFCKGASWGDHDGDGFPDLFVNNLNAPPCLYRNNGNGTFTDVAERSGITGPRMGFSCWFFDHDNDGWLDIFASSYDPTLDYVVQNMLKRPHDTETCRLYRNLQGDGFEDVTDRAGVALVCAPMGSNFFDADNDGFLDFYLATGDPKYSVLIPNRLFRNVEGRRFSDATLSSETGHLQKGHAVAAGDWDRDGNVDLFVQLGGAVPGDKAHNVLFQNPGHDHAWIMLKLVGTQSNRAAIGARIKIVLAGDENRTIYRHVTAGSSFGANSLQQTIGLGKARGISRLEVYWPASGRTQVFESPPIRKGFVITEGQNDLTPVSYQRLPVPAG